MSAICTFAQTFEQDVALWERLGLACVGLFAGKLEAFGYQNAVNALSARNMCVSCITHAPFNLAEAASWDQTRTMIGKCIDTAAVLGGCVYGPPGRLGIGEWDRQVEAYNQAIEPCLAYALSRNVRLAIEPSLRTQYSFVHNLNDARDMVDRVGIGVVVDVGNCWMERDADATIRHLGKRIALVQLSDYALSSKLPSTFGRGLPGEGDLPFERFVQAAVDAGYDGPFEVEFMPSEEMSEPAIRRSLEFTSAVLDGVIGRYKRLENLVPKAGAPP